MFNQKKQSIDYTTTKRCRVKYFKKNFKEIAKKYLLVGSVVVVLIIAGFVLNKFFPAKPIQSAASDNVSGWAWSETIGWISFNSTNCDSDGNGITDTGNYSQCPVGQPISSYGVTVNPTTGDFSGYAWAGGGVDAAGNPVPTIGWISFNRAVTGNPPAAPYNGGSGPIANLSFATKKVRGWARVLANDGGWDGWIKLGDDSGTWPAGGSQVYVQVQAGPDELRGWAWGGRDVGAEAGVVGWVSLNCADRGVCGSSSYKVLVNINFPPSVSCNVIEVCQNPPWDCCRDSRHPVLTWTFNDQDGDTQTAYQIQIDVEGSSDFIPTVKLDKTASDTDSKSYTVSPADMIVPGDDMQWGQTYYWRVKVRDSRGSWSSSWSTCTVAMPLHAYPDVDFSPSPQKPSAEENVRFIDNSTCHDDVPADSECTKPNDSYSWTFIGPGTVNYDDPLTPTFESPVVSFSDPGSWDVKLEVTDSSGFMCPSTKSVKVSLPLPEWKEIIPR